jgi:hypothetical protein
MPFNLFLLDDLLGACEKRFKRSKTDAATYRQVWEGLKLWVAFQYGNGRGCDLPQFGRIVLQPLPGGDGVGAGAKKKLAPFFVLSSRAKERHGLRQAKAEMVSSKRMHVAKLNHAAIATACGLERDVVGTAVKELLWCALESMANVPSVLINLGVGDLQSAKGAVRLNFEVEPGQGTGSMRPLAPLTTNRETEIDRLELQSSASTLRPPSAAGTELDWDSLVTTTSKAPSEPTIAEGEEGEEVEEAAGTGVSEQQHGANGAMAGTSDGGGGGVPELPPIAGAAATPADEDGQVTKDVFGIGRSESEQKRLAKEYLENHKSGKDWLANQQATRNGHDQYLDRVFDRYEGALLRSEAALRDEATMMEQARCVCGCACQAPQRRAACTAARLVGAMVWRRCCCCCCCCCFVYGWMAEWLAGCAQPTNGPQRRGGAVAQCTRAEEEGGAAVGGKEPQEPDPAAGEGAGAREAGGKDPVRARLSNDRALHDVDVRTTLFVVPG